MGVIRGKVGTGYTESRTRLKTYHENSSLFLPLWFCDSPFFFFKVVLISCVFFIFAFSFRIGCRNGLNLF